MNAKEIYVDAIFSTPFSHLSHLSHLCGPVLSVFSHVRCQFVFGHIFSVVPCRESSSICPDFRYSYLRSVDSIWFICLDGIKKWQLPQTASIFLWMKPRQSKVRKEWCHSKQLCVRACACVRSFVRAFVRACVGACVRVRARVPVCVGLYEVWDVIFSALVRM